MQKASAPMACIRQLLLSVFSATSQLAHSIRENEG
jgi:hypothetical protein